MRITRRVWNRHGYIYVEAAEGNGENYWIDMYGRIGLEDNNGRINWFVADTSRFLAVESLRPDPLQLDMRIATVKGAGNA